MNYVRYDTFTGLLTGDATYCPDAALLASNAVDGHEWIAGQGHPDTHKVDLTAESHTLVEYEGPSPAETPHIEWVRDPVSRRWKSAPKLALHQQQGTEAVKAMLGALDQKLIRPLSEIVLSTAQGQVAPASAIQILAAIQLRKDAVRSSIGKIAQAASLAEVVAAFRAAQAAAVDGSAS